MQWAGKAEPMSGALLQCCCCQATSKLQGLQAKPALQPPSDLSTQPTPDSRGTTFRATVTDAGCLQQHVAAGRGQRPLQRLQPQCKQAVERSAGLSSAPVRNLQQQEPSTQPWSRLPTISFRSLLPSAWKGTVSKSSALHTTTTTLLGLCFALQCIPESNPPAN